LSPEDTKYNSLLAKLGDGEQPHVDLVKLKDDLAIVNTSKALNVLRNTVDTAWEQIDAGAAKAGESVQPILAALSTAISALDKEEPIESSAVAVRVIANKKALANYVEAANLILKYLLDHLDARCFAEESFTAKVNGVDHEFNECSEYNPPNPRDLKWGDPEAEGNCPMIVICESVTAKDTAVPMGYWPLVCKKENGLCLNKMSSCAAQLEVSDQIREVKPDRRAK
jgi:hypothetical protein